MSTEDDRGWAPGAQILVRDEVWMVRSVTATEHDGDKITAVGMSGIVRDQEATFFTAVERVRLLRPEETTFVPDTSERFRRGRLFLEAMLRKTPLPQSERRLAMAEKFLLRHNPYQQRPAELALQGLRPRILIADVVGLGKTLEVGLTLAELIRRGRGERILVVTPQQVLEQFQRELWTRFAIPLIRLDSVGIQRIQREIPAGRNPFTYYRRVIISIDTLKQIGQYRHHLQNIHWDAVVIDESHNLIGGKNLRAQLAKVLAPRTDALLLASATPHNGDRRSFADLIDLLDPAAIVDRDTYQASDIEHLYIRRTKVSPEVKDHLHGSWAERGPSLPIHCPATDAEERVFAELTHTWLEPGTAVASRGDDRLFAFNLLKSFLSSHHALIDTVERRLKALETAEQPLQAQRSALERLRDLVLDIGDADAAKLSALVAKLREIGVGPRKPTRVVVFSERVATLRWLSEVVPAALGFEGKAAADAVDRMDGAISDQEQLRIIEQFGLAASPVRLLFSTDVFSEGVNLHQQCHHMIHYDLPWSLIRIEQRNGRIDRFGQLNRPEFAALILTSQIEGAKDDTTVAEKLLKREESAHLSLGSAETVTGLYDAKQEDDRLVRDLIAGKSVEESLDAPTGDDLLSSLLDGTVQAPAASRPEQVRLPTLFSGTEEFADGALRELYGTGNPLEITREDGVLGLTPPEDLIRRLKVLPPSYVKDQRLHERLLLTFDQRVGDEHLSKALRRSKSETAWPAVSYAADTHPFVDWLVDKLLVRVGRQEALVLHAAVDEPVYLIQGMYSNAKGRPTVVEWMAVSGLPDDPQVERMFDVLERAGVGPEMTNPLRPVDSQRLEGLLPDALTAAGDYLDRCRADSDARIEEPLRQHLSRLSSWEQLSLFEDSSSRRQQKVRDTAHEQRELVKSLRTTGEPFLRVLAVLEAGV